MNLSTLSPAQLREAADLQERIQGLQADLNQILGGTGPAPAPTPDPAAAPALPVAPARGRKKRRKLSPQAIANIQAGVAKRVARQRGEAPATAAPATTEKRKRTLSPAGRRALIASAKARWAKAHAQGKTSL